MILIETEVINCECLHLKSDTSLNCRMDYTTLGVSMDMLELAFGGSIVLAGDS